MNFDTSLLMNYLVATLVLIAVIIVTYVIARLVKYFITYISGKTGFSDWMMKFHFGRAIIRSGMTVGEFFGRVSEWIILLTGALLGLAVWFQLINYGEISATVLNIIYTYIYGFVKTFIIIVIGFILTDSFIGYIYKGGDSGGSIEFLMPVAEYLRLLFYLAVLIFALEVGGLSVKSLTTMLMPIVWGLTIIMIVLAIGKITIEVLSKVKRG
ncbi:hypothetical protein ACSU1N_07200 [Thermogladius sp. 4427co]|uniref:hypothetical protein n=1 Tax=Thermogladius sp. 4427co TaxID=3450718 RepID=UPI003F797C4C